MVFILDEHSFLQESLFLDPFFAKIVFEQHLHFVLFHLEDDTHPVEKTDLNARPKLLLFQVVRLLGSLQEKAEKTTQKERTSKSHTFS